MSLEILPEQVACDHRWRNGPVGFQCPACGVHKDLWGMLVGGTADAFRKPDKLVPIDWEAEASEVNEFIGRRPISSF